MSSLDPATVLFFATLFVGVITIVILRGKHWAPVTGGMAVFMAIAVLFGGIAWAGVPGVWSIGGNQAPPTPQSIFTARVLGTSSVDVAGTVIVSPDGLTGEWDLLLASMHGLGSVDLLVDVENHNTGNLITSWPFAASVTACTAVLIPGSNIQAHPCLNNPDGTYQVTFALTGGLPTGTQSGNHFTSNDWVTGASSTFHATMAIDTAAVATLVQGSTFSIIYNIGGITVTAKLLEST